MALTDKQEMFCREYRIDLNATQAAIRVEYSVKMASRTTLRYQSKLGLWGRTSSFQSPNNELVYVD
ncbi:terminase small subunit [Yersinia ruckeri]